MKTKEELIKEAFDMGWGAYHDCATKSDYKNSLENCLIELGYNNNGWIKIESEDDLPKENGSYWFLKDGIIQIFDRVCEYEPNARHLLRTATHYQPIIKPLKPLY